MNKEKHSKEVVEIANTIVNECGNAPCKECMWCDAATWAHAKALYNADYRKQEWISVEESLPEGKVNCLVHYKHAYCDNDGYWAIGVSFYDGNEFHIGLEYKVTHWMPLPEAPKMKGGAE